MANKTGLKAWGSLNQKVPMSKRLDYLRSTAVDKWQTPYHGQSIASSRNVKSQQSRQAKEAVDRARLLNKQGSGAITQMLKANKAALSAINSTLKQSNSAQRVNPALNSFVPASYAGSIGSASSAYGSSGYGSGNLYGDLRSSIDYNNALNISMFREQNSFNAYQAQLQRDWEEQMSSTAHQRQVADLKAAGLNPILAANGGASTPQGMAANSASWSGADTALTGALAQILSATLSANATMTAAGLNAQASMYGSDLSLKGTKYSTDKYSKTALIGTGISSATGLLGDILSLKSPVKGKKNIPNGILDML